MRRLLLLTLLTGCVTARKAPYEPALPFNPPVAIVKRPLSEERALPAVDVLAEGNTSLRVGIKAPRGREVAGPVRFRVSESSGFVSFRPGDRKFSLAKPRLPFSVPFNVREGLSEFRFVVEYHHCPKRGTEPCFQEQGYYRVTLKAAKGRGLSYVPVTVRP
jgi:hypothetical protein